MQRSVPRLPLPSVLLALAAAALAPSLGAQVIDPTEVAFTGVLRHFSGSVSSICSLPTHELECSDGKFFLKSSTLDLEAWLGQDVKLYGNKLGICPVYDIHAVENPPPATLAICGTGGLGCPIRLRSGPGGISQHVLLVSLAPGLVTFNPLKGSLLLGTPVYMIGDSGAGSFPPEGAAFDLTIPGAPILTGVKLYFQAVRRNVGPVGPMQFSNAACLEIVGFVFTCEVPGC